MIKRIWVAFIILLATNNPISLFAQRIGQPAPKSRAIVKEGIELHEEERYEAAIKNFLKIENGDSLYPLTQYEIGLSYSAMKKYQESNYYMRRALAENYDYERDVLMMIAANYDYMNKMDSAMYIYALAQKRYPYTHRVHYEKAGVYLRRKDFANALKGYQTILNTNPYHANTHLQIGFIAAESDEPALAVMAYLMNVMLNTNGKNTMGILGHTESIAKNEYHSDSVINRLIIMPGGELETINEIIKSKVALNKGYKLKCDFDFSLLRQLQAICEKLPDNAKFSNPILNFYTGFYKEMYNKGLLNGLAAHILVQVNNPEVQKKIKSAQSDKDKFIKWAGDYLNQIRAKRTIVFDGKQQEMNFFYYNNNQVEGIGKLDEKGKKQGRFEFYYDSGTLSAEGNFKNDIKIGNWKYYYSNGKLKSDENYDEKGLTQGKLPVYFENGCLAKEMNFLDDKQDGEIISYFKNGAKRSSAVFSKGKENGRQLNYYSSGGLKEEFSNKDGNIDGPFKTYYQLGQLKSEGNYKGGKMEGKVINYHINGKVELEISYKNDKAHGPAKRFYDSGKIKSEENYDNGNNTGLWKFYREDGSLERTENYSSSGNLNGLVTEFYKDGKKFSEFNYASGKLADYKYYKPDGSIFIQKKTENGKLFLELYNDYLIKTREGQIINGKEQGEWKEYYRNGRLSVQFFYKDGIVDSLFITYHLNGQIKEESMFRNGKRDGFSRTYFKNGKVNTEGYYINGEQQGKWNFYFGNGKIKSSEFYNLGNIEGEDKTYLENGELAEISVYKDGWLKQMIMIRSDLKGDTANFICGEQTIQFNYVNGKPYYVCSYINGYRTGDCKTYYKNGNLWKKEPNKNGKLEGTVETFYANKKPKMIAEVKNGDYNGKAEYFRFNGGTDLVCHYKNDELDGHYIYYHENGKPSKERIYKMGEKDGISKIYGPDGELAVILNYDNGYILSYSYLDASGKEVAPIALKNETGTIKAYYPNGKVSIEYSLSAGELNGTYKIYYTNGQLFRMFTYKDNEAEGESKTFYPDGKIMEEEFYVFDELDGKNISYHPNGKKQSERTFVFGKEFGITKLFDVNGKEIFSYEN